MILKENKALFLDRDGVINEDYGYVYLQRDFKFRDGVIKTLKSFQDLGFILLVVTNQSGIGRGYFTSKDFKLLDDYMKSILNKNNISIHKTYYCPHIPEDNCLCRKPKTKMIEEAIEEYNISRQDSIFIGDKESDYLASKNSGIGHFFYLGKSQISGLKQYNSIEKILLEYK